MESGPGDLLYFNERWHSWNPQIINMVTDRHNLACSMIFKAISKTGSLGSCFVCMDIGSSERLAMQNLQIPDTAETRIIPKWLFPSRFSDKNRFTSSRPDVVLVASISTKTKRQQTSNEGVGFLEVAGGNWGTETGRTFTALPAATNRSPFSRQHWPKDLSFLQRDIHLIEVKYCEDTRPQNQLSAAQEQHKGLCSILQGAFVTLYNSVSFFETLKSSDVKHILFGVGKRR